MKNKSNTHNHHSKVLEERNLVSEMSRCDGSHKKFKDKVKCYLKATKKSRKHTA